MSKMQEIEINRYHKRIEKDIRHLIEHYREIMAWDIPENDSTEADKLIFKAFDESLSKIKNETILEV